MSLAPGEQRTLAEIECRLSKSDPALAAMFARFTAEGRRKQPLLRRRPRRGQGPGRLPRIVILAAVIVTLLVACVAVAAMVASSAPHRPAAATSPAATRSALTFRGRVP